MQTTNDTQHVERIESGQSSSGWPTQRLSAPSQPALTATQFPTASRPGSYPRNRNNAAGIALIVVGLLIWLFRGAPSNDEITAGMILFTIASPFLFLAFWRRIFPLFIPGAILAGLGLGIPLASITNGISVVWGLALSFVAIYLLGRRLFNIRVPWAVTIPAVVLFAIGVIIGIGSGPIFFGASLMWVPLLLIGAGLYLGWGRSAP